MLIHNIAQLLTLAGGAQRGSALGSLAIRSGAALLVRGGLIERIAAEPLLLADFPNEPRFDAGGRVVMPALVDAHTHLVWAGDRAAEFELRLQGKTYQEIAAAGGGIRSTVRATRAASVAQLKAQARPRIQAMLRHGTATTEAKTGYALQHPGELNQLQALLELDREGPLEILPTYMAAHDIPPEYAADPDGYVEQLCAVMLPEAHGWWQAHAAPRPLPFVDVFCESIAFNREQSRRILETARALGFPLKIHADEFDNLGGAALAASLGAVSADHLVKTSPADIAALDRKSVV